MKLPDPVRGVGVRRGWRGARSIGPRSSAAVWPSSATASAWRSGPSGLLAGRVLEPAHEPVIGLPATVSVRAGGERAPAADAGQLAGAGPGLNGPDAADLVVVVVA